MADVTISELAGVVGVSVDKLLSQIKEAGLPHTKADELISNDDKNTLLVFLRRSHGDRDATSAAPKKITLKRKTLGTLKSASSTGRGKTVNVEVRKKRTYVKRSAIETPVEEELPAAELEPEVEETAADAVAHDASAVEEAEKEAAAELKPETTPSAVQAQDVPPPESDANRGGKGAPRRKKAAGKEGDESEDKKKAHLRNKAKAQASDFNSAFYASKGLKVTSNLIDRSTQVVLVKSFANKGEGMGYYDIFTSNREDLIELNSSGYDMVLISNENYVTLFKNKDISGYVEWFAGQYLSGK